MSDLDIRGAVTCSRDVLLVRCHGRLVRVDGLTGKAEGANGLHGAGATLPPHAVSNQLFWVRALLWQHRSCGVAGF